MIHSVVRVQVRTTPVCHVPRALRFPTRGAHYPIKLPFVRMQSDLANFTVLISLMFLTAALLVVVW
jgi:hypothetical protein